MHRGLAAWQATGVAMALSNSLAFLAEAYGKVGQPQEGLHLLAEALAAVDKTKECCWEAELYRLKGELLLIKGEDEAKVEVCFQRARTIARRQSARSWELRAAMSLSRLWQRQGRKAKARELLQGIYDWFTGGFDTADLKEAMSLLDELA